MRSFQAASIGAAGVALAGTAALTAWGAHITTPYASVRGAAPPRPSPLPGPVPPTALPVSGLARSMPLYTAPQPDIITRVRWGADESLRDKGTHYADAVRTVVLHHTDTGNAYDCSQVPGMIRNLYTGHVKDRGWGDIAYNFLIDKCGTIYEGRAGGIERPVIGAHTVGFNNETMGVAAIGTFPAGTTVPQDMIDAIAKLSAWKLGLSGTDPRGHTRLTSTSDASRYHKGRSAVFKVISGHRDGFFTDCPGRALYDRLPEIRAQAARIQGRR